MQKLLELGPFLRTPPDDAASGTIAVNLNGDLCFSFPPPPWSTAEDILRTSGLLVRYPGDELLSVMTFSPMDPHPDGYSEFRFARVQDAEDDWRPTYKLGESGRWVNPRKFVLREDETGSLGYLFANEVFGGPKTALVSYYQKYVGELSISLSYIEWFDKFDYFDDAAVPVTHAQAESHCARVGGLCYHGKVSQ